MAIAGVDVAAAAKAPVADFRADHLRGLAAVANHVLFATAPLPISSPRCRGSSPAAPVERPASMVPCPRLPSPPSGGEPGCDGH